MPHFIGNQPVNKRFGNYVATGGYVHGHPTAMRVQVDSGRAIANGKGVSWYHTTYTSGIAAGEANPRIDVVQVDINGIIRVKKGTAAVHTNTARPYAPTVDANNVKLAEVYIRANATNISNSDDVHNYAADMPSSEVR